MQNNNKKAKLPRVFIVCHADKSSGLGHLLRCLCLAVELRRRYVEVIIVGHFSEQAIEFIRYFNVDYRFKQEICIEQLLKTLPGHANILIDSYELKISKLRGDQKYILIDDFCRFEHYPVAGVLNFTLKACQYNYLLKGAKSQALGLKYFLGHPSLKKVSTPFIDRPQKILILIGSGDPFGLVERVIRAILCLNRNFQLKVLGGEVSASLNTQDINVYGPQKDIDGFYQWADVCITSGGLAKYEAAYLAKPAIVFSQTEAELKETVEFSEAGLCFNFGLASEFCGQSFTQSFVALLENPERRKSAYKKALQVFPKDSAKNAAQYIIDCFAIG